MLQKQEKKIKLFGLSQKGKLVNGKGVGNFLTKSKPSKRNSEAYFKLLGYSPYVPVQDEEDDKLNIPELYEFVKSQFTEEEISDKKISDKILKTFTIIFNLVLRDFEYDDVGLHINFENLFNNIRDQKLYALEPDTPPAQDKLSLLKHVLKHDLDPDELTVKNIATKTTITYLKKADLSFILKTNYL